MIITSVEIRLVSDARDELLAFANVTFDRCFVVREIKLIRGPRGFFIAMPSRRLTRRCPGCGYANFLLSRYCAACAQPLPEKRLKLDERGREALHADIAHPTTGYCRQVIQTAILRAYEKELENSKKPGYILYDADELQGEGAEENPGNTI